MHFFEQKTLSMRLDSKSRPHSRHASVACPRVPLLCALRQTMEQNFAPVACVKNWTWHLVHCSCCLALRGLGMSDFGGPTNTLPIGLWSVLRQLIERVTARRLARVLFMVFLSMWSTSNGPL
jgi:hypothetical protein